MLSANYVVNAFFKTKIGSKCFAIHNCTLWSGWAFASLQIYCLTHMTVSLRAFFHSEWYTPEASAFSASLCIFSIPWGGVAVFGLELDKCIYQQGGECVTQTTLRGRMFLQGGVSTQRESMLLRVHTFERLHLFRGSSFWVGFARCVEPLPLLEGLPVSRCFELC